MIRFTYKTNATHKTKEKVFFFAQIRYISLNIICFKMFLTKFVDITIALVIVSCIIQIK